MLTLARATSHVVTALEQLRVLRVVPELWDHTLDRPLSRGKSPITVPAALAQWALLVVARLADGSDRLAHELLDERGEL